jgi:hypothetical protein
MILAMVRKMKEGGPPGYLVSVKGKDFDFGLGLSDPCRLRADMAIQKILGLINPLSPDVRI